MYLSIEEITDNVKKRLYKGAGLHFINAYNELSLAPDLEDINAVLCAVLSAAGHEALGVEVIADIVGLEQGDAEDLCDRLVTRHYLLGDAENGYSFNSEQFASLMPEKGFIENLTEILNYVSPWTEERKAAELKALLDAHPDEPFSRAWPEVAARAEGVNETAALFRLLHKFIVRGLDPVDVEDEEEEMHRALRNLVAKGLAVTACFNDRRTGDVEVMQKLLLSPSVCRQLFGAYPSLTDMGVLSFSGSIVRPFDIPEKKLFFDGDNARRVEELRRIVREENFRAVAARLAAKGRPAGITCLLYGPPGTGKTELALQVARESGRCVVYADPAKMNGRYVGESEKNIRELFRNYRYAYELSGKAPILLMNEADGILWQRDESPDGSAARSYNIQLSIFLQEMESFEGILIATTNNPVDLDYAFDRRFLYKFILDVPSVSVRVRIWRSMLPGLSREAAEDLASHYVFTGGNISNVASRCDICEVLNGRMPGAEQILAFCNDEESLTACRKGPVVYGNIPANRGNMS